MKVRCRTLELQICLENREEDKKEKEIIEKKINLLDELVHILNPREQVLMKKLYYERENFVMIASECYMSRQSVYQKKYIILRKLEKYIREKGIKF